MPTDLDLINSVTALQSQPEIIDKEINAFRELVNSYLYATDKLIKLQSDYLKIVNKYASDHSDTPYTAFSNNFMPKYTAHEMASDSETIMAAEQELNDLEAAHHTMLSQIKHSFKSIASSISSYNESALNAIYVMKDKISQAITK